MTKKRSRAASAKKRTVKATKKTAPKAARKKTVARTSTKKAKPVAAKGAVAKASVSRKPSATLKNTGSAIQSSAHRRATVKRTGVAEPEGSWVSVFDASPWANPKRSAPPAVPAPKKPANHGGSEPSPATLKKKTAKTSAAASTTKAATTSAVQKEQPDSKRMPAETSVSTGQSLGELLNASPWASRLRTGAASAAAHDTRGDHGRRPVGDKSAVSGEFTDLMAASPWATRPTPAFKRRSMPESTGVSRAAPQVIASRATAPHVTVPQATVTQPAPVAAPASSTKREAEPRRGAAPVPMMAQDASVSPPPLRRTPDVQAQAPSRPAVDAPKPERPSFAPRPSPVSRPAREVQRDELGEAIRELAGAVAESQFVVKKPDTGGISDTDRLKMRLAERQRAVSRATEEPSPRFRPKQRAPIPKRPVVTGTAEVGSQPRAPFDAGATPQATVAASRATASTSSSSEVPRKKKLEKTIPIEGLGRGVFKALGNGVGRIVNVGRQSVSGIALGAKDGARLVSGFFKEKKSTTPE
ncbi:MAG: hypothetical protein FD165_1784 [Gammaproteobacteria bacterium]|nr:MAG: hypothetical protein FD165_1784 [Gammaproteobacteria bacterium]TND04357.1 MAG: hypothetical protein FD120_1471 [Gammaproteobacteria bacterium]